MLDKKTRKTETMKRKVQGFSKQSFPSVWDVQKTGNELKVAVATDGDIRVYRVSLPDKKITGGKWITQRGQTGRMAQYTQLAETEDNKPSRILAYQKEKIDDGTVKEMTTFIYNYHTNETKNSGCQKTFRCGTAVTGSLFTTERRFIWQSQKRTEARAF
ncbi:hypothetical protein [Heyndrickxia coagulans]|uniref:Uncharacterized protein n=1 Tax=Heyndrickxia coagulans TaxID=1398 RepID=A0AAW7CMH2_HEYCO|nr:hypothetical protein [Heyndrickxia coagulans]MDL5041686.1 hypothetical protein [Heyndrickxia coagulans]